ncbi:MAG: DNA translocase FtsK 4TM domain-containing protein [Candidatus Magnetominusculus sp. LBB02]|nr:DNA translocase FtsK 4TM domain-containing protein [Candidatus Magnetominusculus sp. LBB02]
MAETVTNQKNEIRGVIAALFAVFCAVSLFSYDKWDPSPFTYTTLQARNYAGVVGAYFSDTAFSFIGTSAFLIPLTAFIYGIRRLLGSKKNADNVFGMMMLVIAVSMVLSLCSFIFDTNAITGGVVGSAIVHMLNSLFSLVGAFLISLAALVTSVMLMLPLKSSSLLMRRAEEDAAIEPASEAVAETAAAKVSTAPKVSAEPDTTELKIITHHQVQEDVREETPPTRPDIRQGLSESNLYTLPGFELLSAAQGENRETSKEELQRAATILREKLSDFGVEGKISQAHPGPVITMYEFEPAPGVKISKVVALSDDLGRAMGGIKVRVSLIPGKTPIGIEVPNEHRNIVSLKEIIASDKFTKKSSLLTLSLGKDIYGNPIVEDLARMPHLLVAGTTGSGKSVAVNSMVMSILYKAKPSQVRMLMIDPKLLELSIYEGIPHLVSNVITNPKEASDALKKMLIEMERRYRLIAEQGSRNIDMFNASVAEEDRLPYIVIIIDELADLMFTAAKNVEDSIVRLAQMARAAGMHLIVATQRPSVDVITGIIKANFPSRIAFMVSSKVDSRTILDTHGAEKLLGRGDMLVLSPGAKIQRVHGAFVTEEEIKAVVDFAKSQASPDHTFFDSLFVQDTEDAEGGSSQDKDEIYDEVIKYARGIGEVSISSIQRRFKIGYNRAARIVDIMDGDGLIGPSKGAGKPRNFLDG